MSFRIGPYLNAWTKPLKFGVLTKLERTLLVKSLAELLSMSSTSLILFAAILLKRESLLTSLPRKTKATEGDCRETKGMESRF